MADLDDLDELLRRQADMASCCGCSCERCRHQGGGDDHTDACKDQFYGCVGWWELTEFITEVTD